MSDTADRLRALESRGWQQDSTAKRGSVLFRHTPFGTDVASGDSLEEAIERAEWRDGIRAKALASRQVYTPPEVNPQSGVVPTHEGLDTNPF